MRTPPTARGPPTGEVVSPSRPVRPGPTRHGRKSWRMGTVQRPSVRSRDIHARLESLGEARQASPSTARSNVRQMACLFVDPQPPGAERLPDGEVFEMAVRSSHHLLRERATRANRFAPPRLVIRDPERVRSTVQKVKNSLKAARTASGLSSCSVCTARGISTNRPCGSSFTIRSATSRSSTPLCAPRSTRVGTGIARNTPHQSMSRRGPRCLILGCHAHTSAPSARDRRLCDTTQR